MEKVSKNKYQILSKLTEQELIKLQFLLENKEIEDLEIHKFSLQDFDKETLKKLENYHHLRTAYFVIDEEKSIPFFVKLIIGNKLEKITLDLLSKGCFLIFQALNESKYIEHLNIYQNLEKKGLETIKNLINGNTNLKSLGIHKFDYINGKDLDLSAVINGIQDNFSIQHLSLNPINMNLKDFSVQKFQALKTLKLKLRDERNETTNNDYSLSKNQSINLENQLSFSNLFIKKFDFSSSRIDNNDMIYLMRNLKDVAFFEELNLSYSIIFRKNLKEDFSEWLTDLKDILIINKNLNNLNISSISLRDTDFEILFEGFEKNDSLTSLDIEGNTLGKCAGKFGKIFKSKDKLLELFIGDPFLNFNEFMKEFQFQENLKYFYLSKCKLDNESDELISNFLSNNMNMIRLILYVNFIENTKNIFKALDSHKKIKEITIDSRSSIPGKYIVDLIKNNHKFENLSFSNVIFDVQELKDCFDALSKDSIIKSIDLPFLNHLLSADNMKIIEEYLFFNYSLIDFNIDDYKSIYRQRNKDFITNHYKIKNLKLCDLYYSFK